MDGMATTLRAMAALLVALAAGCTPATNYESNEGPRYAWTAPAAPDPVPGLRIVTFNIRYARDVKGALAAIRADENLRGADVLALQEMDPPGVDFIARGLGMSYVYYPAAIHPTGGKDFGNAVLVRGRIERDGKVFLPHLSRGRAMQRIAVWADVDVDGTRFRMYSLHLSADAEMSRPRRLEQLRALVAEADPHDRVVVAGDFNDRAAVGALFESAGYEWVSRDLPPTVAHLFTWDHIFARGLRLAALDRRGVADNRGSSDHRPMWADLVPASIVPRRPRTPSP
jgi:endonuclease/exonuclease/phosphatase family metal-dependent hydrolase